MILGQCTVQLQDLFQVGEDVLDVSRRQDGLFGELLVEHQVQHPQHADVRTLSINELCTDQGDTSLFLFFLNWWFHLKHQTTLEPLTVNDFLSLDLLRPQACQHLASDQLLPVRRVVLRVSSLVVLALDVEDAESFEPGDRER